jgi:DNA polymerase/3'-5' exonuclease PolX
MARTNDDVAALLEEYADLLAITGHEDFKIRVYQKAARSIGAYPDDIAGHDLAALRRIPNVGESIAAKVAEYLSSGTMAKLEELRGRIPAGVRALTRIPALGPKRAMVLHERLGVDSPESLESAINAGALRGLPGFGAKTEENLLHGIALLRDAGQRVHLGVAMPLAEDIVAALEEVQGCRRCGYAGSLRRMKDTIGDIDVLATSNRPKVLMAAFAGLPQVTEVIVRGDKKTSLRTSGLPPQGPLTPRPWWGAANSAASASPRQLDRSEADQLRCQSQRPKHAGQGGAELVDRLGWQVEAEFEGGLGLQGVGGLGGQLQPEHRAVQRDGAYALAGAAQAFACHPVALPMADHHEVTGLGLVGLLRQVDQVRAVLPALPEGTGGHGRGRGVGQLPRDRRRGLWAAVSRVAGPPVVVVAVRRGDADGRGRRQRGQQPAGRLVAGEHGQLRQCLQRGHIREGRCGGVDAAGVAPAVGRQRQLAGEPGAGAGSVGQLAHALDRLVHALGGDLAAVAGEGGQRVPADLDAADDEP